MVRDSTARSPGIGVTGSGPGQLRRVRRVDAVERSVRRFGEVPLPLLRPQSAWWMSTAGDRSRRDLYTVLGVLLVS